MSLKFLAHRDSQAGQVPILEFIARIIAQLEGGGRALARFGI